MDIIHGQRWYEICDAVIDTGVDPISKNVININYGFENVMLKNCIIFCKPDHLLWFLDYIKQSNYDHILISNNSDYPITEELYNVKPANIKWWFAENVACHHDNLIPIPIGLERPLGGGVSADYEAILKNMNTPKTKLLYMNHNDVNNSLIRTPITQKYKTCSWVTTESNVSFQEYIYNMSQHKFVLSPYGNGIDCHRTWEALYLGVIPIVNKSIIAESIRKHIPIIVVDDMTTITKEFLNNIYDEISTTQYNNGILEFEWWKTLITTAYRSIT